MPRSFRLSDSRSDPRRDVEDEIRFHLEMRAREYMERGMSPEDARRAAGASFGDVAAIEAECRDVRLLRSRDRARRDWWQGMGFDLRVAVRALWKRPAFTLAAVVTLALGIGATAAVFAIVSGVLLRPLPYHDPSRLAMVWHAANDVRGPASQLPLSAPNYLDIQREVRAFESIAAFRAWPYSLGDGEPEQVMGVQATPTLFTTLGVRPLLGRDFTEGEAVRGGPKVAILGYALWRRRYGADPALLGRQISLGGDRFTVIGIAPPDFAFPRGAELPSGLQFAPRTDVWTPLIFSVDDLKNRWTLNIAAVARLRAGATFEDARTQVDRLAKQLDTQYLSGKGQIAIQVLGLDEQAAAPVRRSLLVLLGAVGLVLIIACVNVASLLIARTGARRRELAVRAAIGAGAARLARQLVTENLVLASAGAALGLVVATLGTRAMLALVPGQLPRADDIAIDWRVLLVAGACAVLAGSLFGVAAAVHARRAPLADDLYGAGARTTGGAARSAGRRLLVGAEIALCLMLLVGAGLLMVSFARLQRVDPGFTPSHAVTAHVALPIGESFDFRRDGPRWRAFFEQLVMRVGALPSVRAAGAVSTLPLTGAIESSGFAVEGQPPASPGQGPSADYAVVGGEYFRAMGIALRAGRAFTSADRAESPPVAVVNRELEQRYFRSEGAIGQRIKGGFELTPTTRTIIGVVDDVRQTSLDLPPVPAVYVPESQMSYPGLALVVRTEGDPIAVLPLVRRELRALDATIPLSDVRTLDDVVATSLARQRFSLTLLGAFGIAALLLAIIGLYGVIALSVGERRRELGVRIALGARRQDVLSLVLGEGVRVATGGVIVGLGAAYAASRVMQGMLYGVSATDPRVYLGAAGVVVIVAMVASWLPARSATRVDPLVALRAD